MQTVKESDYKVFVFDLDNTLYLHGADEMYKQIYLLNILEKLEELKMIE